MAARLGRPRPQRNAPSGELLRPHRVDGDRPLGGLATAASGATLGLFVRSTFTIEGLLTERPKSGALIDAAIAAAALLGSLAMLGHGIGFTRPESKLDVLGGTLAAC